jgi:predicted neuraminidase
VPVLVVALTACATSAPGNAEGEPRAERKKRTVPETAMSTAGFEARIAAKGGRVDFVFGDERPFRECHASTIVEEADGSLICAWFGGAKEKDPDVGIWWSRFVDGAWTAPQTAAKLEQKAHWNPVLFRDPSRGTYLFFKVGKDVPGWQTYWAQTDDGGQTWQQLGELVAGDVGGRGPVKNKAVVLSDGSWLAPASTEEGRWLPFADRSTDGGKTWERSANWEQPEALFGRRRGSIQPTYWESAPGKVHALMRTSAGFTGRVDSDDGGKTWTAVRDSGLPNNNSGLDALGLEDGRVLLVYNPIGENWGARTPLNLAVSSDNGESWTDIVSLETAAGEYSYPAIVRTQSGVAITYTWKRERVRCWQVPLEALDVE